MSYDTVINLTAGVLQCAVLGYGLWLTRCFGAARVGWSLVCIFSVLALLRIFLFETSFAFGVKVDVIFSVIALLLLAGMIQLEILLRERLWVESVREETRQELENRIGKQTTELTKVNGEL